MILITGTTSHRLLEIKGYGNLPYTVGKNGVLEITDDYIKYVIGDITYTTPISLTNDINNSTGTTIFEYQITATTVGTVSGVTNTDIIVYDDSNHFLDKKETNNSLFINRNNFSVFEYMYKLSEVDQISDFVDFPLNYL